MKELALSQKYATAVFSLALEPWLTSLKTVQDRLADNAELAERLADTNRTFSDRQKELDGLIPGNDQVIRNFFYTLLENENIGMLSEVMAELERMSSGGPQVQTARITTVVALSEDEKDAFRQKLRHKYGDTLQFVFSVNPTIVGGVIVQVGDKVIDGSVSARLEALGNSLGVKN